MGSRRAAHPENSWCAKRVSSHLHPTSSAGCSSQELHTRKLACLPRLNRYNVGLFGPRSKWNNSNLTDIACRSSQAGEMPLCTYPCAVVVIRLCYRPLVGLGPVDSSPQDFIIKSRNGLPQKFASRPFLDWLVRKLSDFATFRNLAIESSSRNLWQAGLVEYLIFSCAQRSAPNGRRAGMQ